MKRKLFFLLIVVSFFTTNLSAQFTQQDIEFWVGEGENSAILNIDFIVDGEESSFAWGVHFDGASTTGADILNVVATADAQLTVNASSFLNDIFYQDFSGEAGIPLYWSTWSKTNDGAEWVTNFGIDTEVTNGNWFGCSYTDYDDEFNPINEPAFPIAVPEPIFTQENILFWVGEGDNTAILNVDFILDGEASSFAWGVHFDGTITGLEILFAVANADEQFTVNAGTFLNDIFYFDMAGVAGNPLFWTTWTKDDDLGAWYTNIGVDTEISDGQWYGCSYTEYTDDYIPINEPGYPLAVENNNYIAGPYAPGASETGTTAIASDDTSFSSWAATCTVTRGSQDISDNTAADAIYGTDADASGAADGLSVVSLGDGGSAILTFDPAISDNDGADFAVFENGFGDNFLELAFVEVSSDGINYFRFPSVSLTSIDDQVGGFGELDPTFINNFAGKYKANFGTPFDLNELAGEIGLDIFNITHVKIIDVVGSIDSEYGTVDSEGNIVNDPFPTLFESGGFDLDAVGVINSTVNINENSFSTINIYPNPAANFIKIKTTENGRINIIDQTGKICFQSNVNSNSVLDISELVSGIYVIQLILEKRTLVSKLIIKK